MPAPGPAGLAYTDFKGAQYQHIKELSLTNSQQELEAARLSAAMAARNGVARGDVQLEALERANAREFSRQAAAPSPARAAAAPGGKRTTRGLKLQVDGPGAGSDSPPEPSSDAEGSPAGGALALASARAAGSRSSSPVRGAAGFGRRSLQSRTERVRERLPQGRRAHRKASSEDGTRLRGQRSEPSAPAGGARAPPAAAAVSGSPGAVGALEGSEASPAADAERGRGPVLRSSASGWFKVEFLTDTDDTPDMEREMESLRLVRAQMQEQDEKKAQEKLGSVTPVAGAGQKPKVATALRTAPTEEGLLARLSQRFCATPAQPISPARLHLSSLLYMDAVERRAALQPAAGAPGGAAGCERPEAAATPPPAGAGVLPSVTAGGPARTAPRAKPQLLQAFLAGEEPERSRSAPPTAAEALLAAGAARAGGPSSLGQVALPEGFTLPALHTPPESPGPFDPRLGPRAWGPSSGGAGAPDAPASPPPLPSRASGGPLSPPSPPPLQPARTAGGPVRASTIGASLFRTSSSGCVIQAAVGALQPGMGPPHASLSRLTQPAAPPTGPSATTTIATAASVAAAAARGGGGAGDIRAAVRAAHAAILGAPGGQLGSGPQGSPTGLFKGWSLSGGLPLGTPGAGPADPAARALSACGLGTPHQEAQLPTAFGRASGGWANGAGISMPGAAGGGAKGGAAAGPVPALALPPPSPPQQPGGGIASRGALAGAASGPLGGGKAEVVPRQPVSRGGSMELQRELRGTLSGASSGGGRGGAGGAAGRLPRGGSGAALAAALGEVLCSDPVK